MTRFTLGMLAGCYDCFHAGHRYFLDAAARRCTNLIVLVASDESIRRLKNREPVDTYSARVANVRAACGAVIQAQPIEDHGQLTLEFWTRYFEPDVLIVADDQLNVPDKLPTACRCGVPVLILPRSPLDISTSRIVANREALCQGS